jgi:prepilin-type N-terminal cleavage/methylation domain-containing protein
VIPVSNVHRDGFSLIEAVIALAIIGLAGVAALASLGAELRGAEHSRWAIEATALAGHRLAVLELLPSDELRLLPDSVARGRFEPPFDGYGWEASVRAVRNDPDLLDVHVRITGDGGSYPLHGRLYRPRSGLMVP